MSKNNLLKFINKKIIFDENIKKIFYEKLIGLIAIGNIPINIYSNLKFQKLQNFFII